MTASATISTKSDRRASDELGLWEPKRALTLDAARAHTQRIRVLRYALMAISTVLVATLIWQFMTDRRGGPTFLNDPTESVRMQEPRYSGRNADGLPFYLIADTAVRRMSEKNKVLLDNPILKFNRSEGVASSSVMAKTGTYNDLEKVLDLRSDVNLETDDGNICDSSHARIFNVEKRIEGDEAITCTGGFGKVTGNSYAIEDNYKTFIFKDGMTALLTQKEDAVDADAPFAFGGNGPIDVKADTGIYKGEKTDLIGNVVVIQDGAVITSDDMDVFRVQESGGSDTSSVKLGAVRKIIATGNFEYKSEENDIRGEQGVYERDRNIMTVTGDVVVIQPSGNRYEAQKLTYNTKTETIRFSGQCVGRGCEGSGRTRIVIPGSED